MPGTVFYPQARAILQVTFEGFGGKASEPTIIPVLPRNVRVHRNSYNQADSFGLTFDAADLPIPPELIRAGSCEIFLFESQERPDKVRLLDRRLREIKLNDFRPARDAVDEIARELQRAITVAEFTEGHRASIVGLFDESTLEFSSSDRSISIDGQDYTALFSEKQWPPTKKGYARRIKTGARLDRLLNRIIGEADPTGRMKLKLRGVKPKELPVVGKTHAKILKRGLPIESGTTYWDVMYKLAFFAGFIIYVDNLDVVLTLAQRVGTRAYERPKQFIWGKNLSRVLMRRRMGKERAPQIEVLSYDHRKRKPIVVKYPPKDQVVATGTGKTKKESEALPAVGIQDRKVLKRMAESFYNLRSRPEMVVDIETRDLQDKHGDDLLSLRNGDLVELRFDPFNQDQLANMNKSERVQALYQKGYGYSVAEFIADNIDMMNLFNDPFRVREVSYDYDASNGIDIRLELVRSVRLGGVSADG